MTTRPPARVALLAGSFVAVAFLAGCARSDDVPSNAAIVWAGDPGVEAVNVDGSGRRVVVPLDADQQGDPAWSHDGDDLAYWARNSDSVEIRIVRPEAGGRRVVASDWRSPAPPRRQFAYILEPSWAPGGDHLAVSDSWTLVNATIRLVSISPRRWTSLTTPSYGRTDTDPEWSPEGRTIAFVRQRTGPPDGDLVGRPGIFLVERDGSGLRRLVQGRSPSWSPDGRSLVYVSGDTVYRVNADGSGRTAIVSGLRALEVRSAPDGRKLLYTTRAGEESPTELWLMNHDGSDRIRIVRAAVMEDVSWQPG